MENDDCFKMVDDDSSPGRKSELSGQEIAALSELFVVITLTTDRRVIGVLGT